MHSRLTATLVILAMAGAGAALAAKKKAPQTVVIPRCGKKKGKVTFPHALHVKKKLACEVCHHPTKTKQKEIKPCASCHAGKKKGNNPGCAEMSQKKNPYHITCAGCHRKLKQGPTKCKQCHKK